MSDNPSWHAHISARMKEANSVFFLLKRNFSYKLQATCKPGLFKLLLLPVFTYGFYYASLSRADMKFLEKFEKKVVQWITGSIVSGYISQLRLLDLLLLPRFLHLSDILLLVKLSNESNQLRLEKSESLGKCTEIFEIPTTRTERAKGEFTLTTCRLIHNLHEFMHFSVTTGLKEGVLAVMRKVVISGFRANDVRS